MVSVFLILLLVAALVGLYCWATYLTCRWILQQFIKRFGGNNGKARTTRRP